MGESSKEAELFGMTYRMAFLRSGGGFLRFAKFIGRPAAAQIANQRYSIQQALLLHAQCTLLGAQLRGLRGGGGSVIDRPSLVLVKRDLRPLRGIAHDSVLHL